MTNAEKAAALANEIEGATVIVEPLTPMPRKVVSHDDLALITSALRRLAETEARPAGDLQEVVAKEKMVVSKSNTEGMISVKQHAENVRAKVLADTGRAEKAQQAADFICDMYGDADD